MQNLKIIYYYIFFISLLCYSEAAISQAYRENTRAELDGIKASSVNNEVFIDGIGSSGGQKMKYSQVQGSPFFYDEFYPSDFYDRKNKKIGRYMSKYNLASQQFHYLSGDSVELAVDEGIGRVVMYNTAGDYQNGIEFICDPSRFIIEETPYFGFIQQLNKGNTVLYKYLKRSVVVADSLFGAAKKYYFGTSTSYFLGTALANIKLKKLSDDYILSQLQLPENATAWIKENKIKFNKEADVIRFLDYYNSTLK
jgi:hypothetical protein